MASLIEDYGFIGDLHGSALVGKDGSIDWLCLPRFDSEACFASLLGRDEHGFWRIAPSSHVRAARRRYRPGTVVLETDFDCDGGLARVTDFMPLGDGRHSVVRIVEGLRGRVPFLFELVARFGYGRNAPWVSRVEGGLRLMVAPDSLLLRSPVALRAEGGDARAEFEVTEGQRLAFELTWQAAHKDPQPPLNAEAALAMTDAWWTAWSGRSAYEGPYKEAVNSSLVFLKAMTYAPTGGIVAAPTTSLPERLGGSKNYDYRFCWLRDAALTVRSFLAGGYLDEATQLRAWILRAAAGAPTGLQIMYGLEGERRLTEYDVPWLPGYEDSRPVRIGNAAHDQLQLDVYGEVLAVFSEAREAGMPEESTGFAWSALEKVIAHVARIWQQPDEGIWETRTGRKHFVHSKVMAWTAVDRFIRLVEDEARLGRNRDRLSMLPPYRALRERMHREICERGFSKKLGSFTRAYDLETMDSSLLTLPMAGFLPATDPRIQGTIRAVEKELMRDGLLLRYIRTSDKQEGAFLACSFWLVSAYALSGRREEAERLFERLLGLRNDLGLLSEEYDTNARRLIGNFPQGFSHLALITAAQALSGAFQPAGRP